MMQTRVPGEEVVRVCVSECGVWSCVYVEGVGSSGGGGACVTWIHF